MFRLIKPADDGAGPVRRTNFQWLGLVNYREALSLQHQYEREVLSGAEDRVLGLEHPQVITLGKRSRLDPEVPSGQVVWVDRGGEATLHSEGQLVIYPIFNLTDRWSVREWVELLLTTTEKTLQYFQVETSRGEHSGLWTAKGKIAFAGIRVRNRVSTHGLSINVANDLSLFGPMKSCGVRQARMDSLALYRQNPQTREVFEVWCLEFLRLIKSSRSEKALIERPRLVNFPELSKHT